MIGANRFCKVFRRAEQIGRLYILPGSHARGNTFRIYVLPAGEKAIENGIHSPLNKNAVEVYGVVGGSPGWTETYGWIHDGKWRHDFMKIVEQREAKARETENRLHKERQEKKDREADQQALLLSDY